MILRTIHVGVGGNGQWAIDLFGKDPKFRPVALVDTNTTTAKVAQYLLNGMGRENVPIFSGLTGALSQIEADALIICTPTPSHADYCHMGFTISLHALVESPMTMEWNQARELVTEAESSWSKFCIVKRDRYSAAGQTIAQILGTPDHPSFPGEPKAVEFIHHRNLPEGGALDSANNGMWNILARHMDSLAAWLGPAKRVTARAHRAPWCTWIRDPNLSVLIEYATGAVCNYSLSHDSAITRDQITLEGDRGALVLTDRSTLTFHPRSPDPEIGLDPQPVELIDAPAPEQTIVDEFFRYIVEDVQPQTAGKINLQSLAVCEMISRSAKHKKPIERTELT